MPFIGIQESSTWSVALTANMNTRATGLPKTSAFYCPQPVYNPTCISDPTASLHLPHHNAHQNSREQHVVGGLDGKHKHLSHQISQNVIFLMPSVGLGDSGTPTCISNPTASVYLPRRNPHQDSREQHVAGGLDGKRKHSEPSRVVLLPARQHICHEQKTVHPCIKGRVSPQILDPILIRSHTNTKSLKKIKTSDLVFNMYSICKAVAAAVLAFSLAATAAPAAGEEHMNHLAARNAGDFTYYYTGLGACGETNNDSQMVAAVGHDLFDRSRPCGRMIRAHYGGNSADVKVVDRCGGCNDDSLDLSPAAFQQLVGSLGPGRVQGTWEFI
ncbi:Rare lipoprotein A (RlpA)-like protein, partial [Metarhizium brunneum ARSEF 3297]